jgi:hypothetical protein
MLPTNCPSCRSPLKVRNLVCETCHTEVTGLYQLPVIMQLTEEEQRFLLDFVKCSGSLKEMAVQWHKSYPSVRNSLNEIIEKINNYEQK